MSESAWRGSFSRALEALATLLGLIALTFLLMHILPGSPFDQETPLHPDVRAALEQEWKLHETLPRRAWAYVTSIFQGDFGISFSEHRPVSEMIAEGFTETFWLNSLALILIFVFGVSAAVSASVRPDGRWARGVRFMTVALISLPSLFLGPLLIWVFALKLNWLPVAFLDSPIHYLLPVLTLALRPSAYLCRILSSALDEIRTSDVLRAARAKGLSETQVILHHSLRNALIPLLGYCGPMIVGLLSGSFIVEMLFATKGLGRLFTLALSERDLPVILGLTLFYGSLLIAVSFVLDVLMLKADPRLRKAV